MDAPVHVVLKRLGVRLVTRGAELVVIDVLGVLDLRDSRRQSAVGSFAKVVIALGPSWLKLDVGPPRVSLRSGAPGICQANDPQEKQSNGKTR
jgi:hypothetical protein